VIQIQSSQVIYDWKKIAQKNQSGCPECRFNDFLMKQKTLSTVKDNSVLHIKNEKKALKKNYFTFLFQGESTSVVLTCLGTKKRRESDSLPIFLEFIPISFIYKFCKYFLNFF